MAKGFLGSIDFTGLKTGRRPDREYYPGAAGPLVVALPPDPWTGTPLTVPQTIYQNAGMGMRSCGAPYFAMLQSATADSHGVHDVFASLILDVALHSLPVMRSSPEEVHFLFSCHAIFPLAFPAPISYELFSIGVTPNGRAVGRAHGGGDLVSPIGTIRADGSFHEIALRGLPGSAVDLSVDGVVVLVDTATRAHPPGPFIPEFQEAPGSHVRFMAFNGVDGLTRCECTISHVEIKSDAHPIGWLFNERKGARVGDFEYASDGAGGPVEWRARGTLNNNFLDQPGASDYTGDWHLDAAWYDPMPMNLTLVPPFTEPWGNPPTSDPAACITWERRTAYTPRPALATVYTPIGAPA